MRRGAFAPGAGTERGSRPGFWRFGWLVLLAANGALGQEAPADAAALRLMHLSPDAPQVDMLLDGRLLVRDLAFGHDSAYLLVPAGRHEVKVFPHRLPGRLEEAAGSSGPGEGAPSEEAFLEPITTFVMLEAGGYYTAVLAGFYEPPTTEAERGALSIRAAPGGTEISLSGPRGYATIFRGDQLLENLEAGTYTIQAQREGFVTRTYEAQVTPGTTSTVSITLQRAQEAPTEETSFTQQSMPQDVWHKVELQIYRDPFDRLPPPGQSLLRLIHASPRSVRIDLAVTDEADLSQILLRGLGYPNGSDYLRLPAGTYLLELRTSEGDGVISRLPDIRLEPGVAYTFFLVADDSDNYLQILPRIDLVLPQGAR